MFITSSAVAASLTVAPQPLNGSESSAIAQLALTQGAGRRDAQSADEAAHLAAQAWLEHIAPRRRRP